jgi:hypothetical protein
MSDLRGDQVALAQPARAALGYSNVLRAATHALKKSSHSRFQAP